MVEFTERERRIFDLLQDEKSREVFKARKEFADNGYTSSTNTDVFYRSFEKADGFDDMVKRLTDSPYVIYGAGITSQKIIMSLKIMNKLTNCIAIWDRDKNLQGQTIENIPIQIPQNGGGG